MSETQTTERQYAERSRGELRPIKGVVTSTKNDKTITVAIERRVLHPKYKKYIRRHTKVHAHDETQQAKVGDTVQLYESRRYSKTKRFRLGAILKSGGEA